MNLSTNLLDRIDKIRMFSFDIDGVLTDGGIYIGDSGETKRFDVHDGAGIALALRADYVVVFLSGRESTAVRRRAKELGVVEVHLATRDKISTLVSVISRLGIAAEEILYMGDDVNDLAAMEFAGLAVAPSSAVPDVRSRAHYVCHHAGGSGAVREIIEMVMRNQKKWDHAVAQMIGKREGIAQ